MYKSALVSVIVPIYNVESYVGKCIDSILRQTYKNIEIIMVNDGSTDDSRKELNRYEGNPRCIILDKENGGLSSARNAGLDVARGDYVYFIDSDDYIDDRAVESLLHRMNHTDADFCCYRIAYVDDKTGKQRIHGKTFDKEQLCEKTAIIKDAFLGRNIKTTAWSKFFRHSFIENNKMRFQEGIINEDCLFTLSCVLYAEKVAFLDKVLYYALERSSSISRNIKKENITSYFFIFNHIKNLLQSMDIFEEYKIYFYASYVKNILFGLVQSAYRLDGKRCFVDIYSVLDDNSYYGKSIGRHSKLISYPCYLLYCLSLHPAIFYRTVKLLKRFGLKMY